MRSTKELDDLLRQKSDGYSLEPLYAKVPELLRGYVELVYDLNHHATFRLVEPLLYRSSFYDPGRQSFMLSVIAEDERPFVLSTPRLKGPDDAHLRFPFGSPAADELFKMKRTPRPYELVQEITNVPESDAALLRSFFTPTPPKPYQRYTGSGLRWRYFGHACILVETQDISILFDPVLSYTYENPLSRLTGRMCHLSPHHLSEI